MKKSTNKNYVVFFVIFMTIFIARIASAEIISSSTEQIEYAKQGFAFQEPRKDTSDLVELQLKMIDFPFILKYPGNWYVREERYVTGNSMQNPSLFISREPIRGASDQFKVGMSLIYYQNYFISREPSDTAMGKSAQVVLKVVDWDKEKVRLLDAIKNASKKVVSEADIKITNQPAVKIESYNDLTHQITVYIKLNNNLIAIVCEAPVVEFDKYKKTFDEMLDSFMFTR